MNLYHCETTINHISLLLLLDVCILSYVQRVARYIYIHIHAYEFKSDFCNLFIGLEPNL